MRQAGGFAMLALGMTIMAGAAHGQTADALFQEAGKYYDEQTWDRAIELYTQFVDNYATDERVPEAKFKVLNALYRLEKYDDFEAKLRAFCDDYRKTIWGARGKHLLAQFLYQHGRWGRWEEIGALYADSLRDYRDAVGRRKFTDQELRDYVQTLFDASEFYRQWGEQRSQELAEEHLRSIIQYGVDDETTAKAWLRLGSVLGNRGGKDAEARAADCWLTVVKEFSDTESAPPALWALAQQDEQNGEYVRARARYLELRRRYPKSELEASAQDRVRDIERPQLNFGISRSHLPGATIPSHITTRNIGGVQFAAYRLDLFDVLNRLPEELNDPDRLTRLGTKVATWHQNVADEGRYEYHQAKVACPLREAGFYVVAAVADGKPDVKQVQPVNISSLVLVQKYAARSLVSYVASRMSHQPVAGVELRALRDLRNRERLVADGKTDADGLWDTTLPEPRRDDNRQVMTVGRLGQEYVIQEQGLYTWWQPSGKELKAYLFTDRPVYRPENTVHYRAVLRNELAGEYANLPGQQVEVTINDARGQELLKTTLTTDGFGTAGGELQLGSDPTLGVYQVQVKVGDQQSGGQFRVEEYRKPEFKVEIGDPMAEVRPGGAAAVPVKATYYFGAPVADAEVKFVIQRRPYWHSYWWPGPWDWFYADWRQPRPYWGGQQVVTEGTVKTDAEGQAILEFSTTADGSDYTYSIYAEVADVTRRVVDATGSLTVTQHAFYLSAHAGQGLYRPTDDITLSVKAENADRRAVETPVDLELWKMKWVPPKVDPKTEDILVAGHYEREVKVWGDKRLTTDPDSGEETLTFRIAQDGYYEVAASSPDTFDPKARIAASANLWVASDAWKGANYDHANLQLVTEKDLYEKGQTARLLVNSPVPDGALLLTIGAEQIYQTKVIRLQGPSQVIEVPIDDNYSPNVYLSAVVVDTKQVYFADKELMVPPTDNFVTITIASDQEEYKPRTTGTFKLKTTDHRGQAISAQVTLGITDESVYAIQEEMAPDIGVFYHGERRGNAIRTACSFEAYGEYGDLEEKARSRFARPGMGGGGLRGEGAMPPPAPAAEAAPAAPQAAAAAGGLGVAAGGEEPVAIREFFPDTILWQPAVVTDANGEATVTVDFPDSLTTWRATARAVTKETKVGQKVAHVITSKDLIARLQAPRFFTQLDESTISMVITNKTSQPQAARLALQVEGLELVGKPEDQVDVPPYGQARVDRVVRATTPGQATITFTARGTSDSDGVKQTFTVIPHGADKFAAQAGRVGTDGKATFSLDLPAERRDDATKLTVTVSPTLGATLLDALPYLVQYPYGCVEQTTSKFIPCVLVARVLQYTGKPAEAGKPIQVPSWWQGRGLDDLPDMVKVGIKRLSSMQNPDGGFGWFGGMRSDPYMSAYVVYGLTQARLADFDVPDEVLSRAIDFLYANLHLLRSRFDSTAYVAWVLSETKAQQLHQPSADQGRELEDAFQRVYANRDELNDYTRALLVLGLLDKGDREKAEVTWRNMLARRVETETGLNWGKNRWGWYWSEDQVETTAFGLMASLAIDPDDALADKMVQWLVLNRTGNQWYSTKDTATAIMALTRFMDVRQELTASYNVVLKVNGREVKGWEVTPQNALGLDGEVAVDPSLLKTGANQIELVSEGNGRPYFSAMMEYYTKEDPITAASNYIKATRQYYRVTEYTDPQDNQRKERRELLKGGETVASGDQLEVEVTVDADNEFDHICLADPKPAGCEPVDQTSGGTWGGAWMYRELHDEEVTFFVDHLSQGKTTLTYRLRAETPGTFRALPHRGFSMYRPDVRCLSDEAVIRLGERPSQG